MPKYTVTSPIKFKGKRIEIAGTVEMSEDVAKPLIEAGALTAFVAPVEKSENRDAETGKKTTKK